MAWVLCSESPVPGTEQLPDPGRAPHPQAEIRKVSEANATSPTRRRLEHIFGQVTEPESTLRPWFGGMAQQQGLGVGVQYVLEGVRRTALQFRIGAQVSTRLAHRAHIELTLPPSAQKPWFFRISGLQHRYGALDYYGPGPDSKKTGRAAYLYEDLAIDGLLGWNLSPFVRVGASAGYLRANTGPGTPRDVASLERVYPSALVPGLDRQGHFTRWGAFLEVDYRDAPQDPQGGGYYVVEYKRYDDRTLHRHDFGLWEFQIQQFIPLIHQRSTLAFQIAGAASRAAPTQSVPFYLQPAIGGATGLRGFRAYRFRDRHALSLTAEYRHKVRGPLELAVFADAGRVFSRRQELKLRDLEVSFGGGVRVRWQNWLLLRLDVAFSHEGYQIWMRRLGPLSPKPVGLSSPWLIF